MENSVATRAVGVTDGQSGITDFARVNNTISTYRAISQTVGYVTVLTSGAVGSTIMDISTYVTKFSSV